MSLGVSLGVCLAERPRWQSRMNRRDYPANWPGCGHKRTKDACYRVDIATFCLVVSHNVGGRGGSRRGSYLELALTFLYQIRFDMRANAQYILTRTR